MSQSNVLLIFILTNLHASSNGPKTFHIISSSSYIYILFDIIPPILHLFTQVKSMSNTFISNSTKTIILPTFIAIQTFVRMATSLRTGIIVY